MFIDRPLETHMTGGVSSLISGLKKMAVRHRVGDV